jgi:hypothetical protein
LYSFHILFSCSTSGAIFDTGDTLSRQAFEYAIAKINMQSQILARSKIVVHRIDMVDAYDSFSAFKMGKNTRSRERERTVRMN